MWVWQSATSVRPQWTNFLHAFHFFCLDFSIFHLVTNNVVLLSAKHVKHWHNEFASSVGNYFLPTICISHHSLTGKWWQTQKEPFFLNQLRGADNLDISEKATVFRAKCILLPLGAFRSQPSSLWAAEHFECLGGKFHLHELQQPSSNGVFWEDIAMWDRNW